MTSYCVLSSGGVTMVRAKTSSGAARAFGFYELSPGAVCSVFVIGPEAARGYEVRRGERYARVLETVVT